MKFIQKTSSEAAFHQFWLDFGIPGRPQNHQKCSKKQAENIAKKKKAKKHKKNRKKALRWWARRNAQADGEDYGGEKKPSKTAKINAKNWRERLKQKVEGMKTWRWRQELEETKKNWQVPSLRTSSTPHQGVGGTLRAFRQAHIGWLDATITGGLEAERG